MVEDGVIAGSFRDPSGFVFERDGVVYRQVNDSHRAHYEHFIKSGLYDALVRADVLIPHDEVDTALAPAAGAYKIIRPERIDFISYPYEWCFGQLRDAALLTLKAQRIALDFGMSMQDASAFNVQWRRGKPVLIDTLSWVRYDEGQPWGAYRQFCQHFLAPLALMAYRDVRLARLLTVHIDGVPLDLAAGLLPLRARARIPLLLHIFLHARSQARHAGATARPATATRRFTAQAFRGLLDSLAGAISKLRLRAGRTEWSDYYAEGVSYEPDAFEHKKELVRRFLTDADPATVWDLGANAGVFSRIAAELGATTASFDFDAACVEANYRHVVATGEERVLPLVMDLTNPSPAIGWANRERLSLIDRAPTDAVLALALLHHLVIGNNVPLANAADFFARLSPWLVIEFVPEDDAMVQTLLATRDDIFPDYTKEGFEDAFTRRFAIEASEQIKGSDRVLYLMRARTARR